MKKQAQIADFNWRMARESGTEICKSLLWASFFIITPTLKFSKDREQAVLHGLRSGANNELLSHENPSSLLQESPQKNYSVRRIVRGYGRAYSQAMKVALNFPTFRAGAGVR